VGSLLCVALPPLPEVHAGDDLAALIAKSWRAAVAADPSLAPQRGDVLVVTQKIVSKAEGCVVDLTTITPRPEAVEFAARWERDARQVEVVLRESAEVLRMERGIVISRTRHGFVCANAGVDASNTGGKDLVTLLPEDSDASAGRLRARLPALMGIPDAEGPAVVISDSFGRPWRFGIVDVALGVAGLAPLDDLRGRPDADGRIMHSTIVALADEIASAAELASGKTSGQPVVLVRGAPGVGGQSGQSGQATVRGDVVMPPEMDLFR
jgi:coenzyme F420-0:L-glutamate ligase/coenzyme F420-1:gamma-L-glutamate ligase